MEEVVYVVEEYIHWEGSEVIGAYTDKNLANEKIEKMLAKSNSNFTKNTYADEWTTSGSVSYIINTITLNQDLR